MRKYEKEWLQVASEIEECKECRIHAPNYSFSVVLMGKFHFFDHTIGVEKTPEKDINRDV